MNELCLPIFNLERGGLHFFVDYLNTKINDNDISLLKNIEKVEITRYKDYNKKINLL